MKTIYLFRHGDTEETGSDTDYNRKLTDEGRLRSAEMAAYLKIAGFRPDLIISSGALRARTTAAVIAVAFGYPDSKIEIDDNLYFSKNETEIIPLIQKTSAGISSVMLVGHNPLLSDFASYICGCCSVLSMRKSSVIRLDFNSSGWDTIAPGKCNINFYKAFSDGSIIDATGEIAKLKIN